MRPLKIVLTACGCPGASTMIRMLRKVKERRIKIIGTDMRVNTIGRFLADNFYQVPPGADKNYIEEMLKVVKKEAPDILLPASSYEVYPIAANKKQFENVGVKVLISEPDPIEICSNKYLMYETLKGIVDLPKYYFPQSLDEFLECSKKLGYPERQICFKPPKSKGSRGFRILKENIDKADMLLNYTHSNKYITMADFRQIFQDMKPFPELLVMEFLEGKEFTVDAILKEGEILLFEVKTREEADSGLAMYFEKYSKPELVEYTRKILKEIPLDYCVNVQTKGMKLLEINPRISTFVYQENLILPYLAVKLLLGEIKENELRAYQSRVQIGWKSVRYYDQVFFS